MRRDQLVDGHERAIGDLRLSVTDRCNFRCQYCMPADGLPWLDRSEVLSFEEIERLVALFAAVFAGLLIALLAGGGNPPPPEDEARDVVTRFAAASAEKDYQ
ncbi:MAG: radical SAM protein, partial [Actinomycetota bacterium]|nr:radical SAM protein [Actinomycetota bacterium]